MSMIGDQPSAIFGLILGLSLGLLVVQFRMRPRDKHSQLVLAGLGLIAILALVGGIAAVYIDW